MAKAKFDIKSIDIKAEATTALYAGAGAADLAVETVREYVADVQKKVTEVRGDVETKVADLQKKVTGFEPKSLRTQAQAAVNTRVESLTGEAKTRRAAVEAKVTELQAEAKALPTKVQSAVNENVTSATAAYADLAKRGESAVARIRKQEAAAAPAPAKKAPAKKAPAKKAPAKTAAKKAPAKKATAKKAAAKKA